MQPDPYLETDAKIAAQHLATALSQSHGVSRSSLFDYTHQYGKVLIFTAAIIVVIVAYTTAAILLNGGKNISNHTKAGLANNKAPLAADSDDSLFGGPYNKVDPKSDDTSSTKKSTGSSRSGTSVGTLPSKSTNGSSTPGKSNGVSTPAPSPTPTPVLSPVTSPTSTPIATPSTWSLQYSTNFGSLSGWTVYNNQTQNNDNSINLSNNVSAGASGLTILGKRESGYSRPFTSGEIVGKGSQVTGNYFRAEVTGNFSDIKGVWPALLWFRPNNANDGELDVMEWMGGLWSSDQKRVAVTMHNEYGSTQDSIKKPLLLKYNSWYNPSSSHTYTIEKVPGKITVWIDGHQVSTFSAADKSWWNRIMEVSDRTWYPRLTLQIGQGAVTKTVPDPDASFQSTTMNVSSLKIWKYNR